MIDKYPINVTDWKIGALDLALNLNNKEDRDNLKKSFSILDNSTIAPELRQLGLAASDSAVDASQFSIIGANDVYSLGKVLHSCAQQIDYVSLSFRRNYEGLLLFSFHQILVCHCTIYWYDDDSSSTTGVFVDVSTRLFSLLFLLLINCPCIAPVQDLPASVTKYTQKMLSAEPRRRCDIY